MMNPKDIFSITTQNQFHEKALEVFNFQFNKNAVYRSFCDLLYIHPSDVKSISDIPFLPIQFFKTHTVVSFSETESHDTIFTSSGTTGTQVSKHYVKQLDWYEASFNHAFKQFYGQVSDYVILALLPSYLEREGSSLIYMVNALIKQSNHPESGFYLHDLDVLAKTLKQLDASGKKVLLLGVSYALLDLIEKHSFALKHTVVMETGGMKGQRKELVKQELHDLLCTGFGVEHIHSEYGMTELLSQAYSKGNGIFKSPPWMKVLVRDPQDPFTIFPEGKTGGVNIIDLANIHSCAFIATQDLGLVCSGEQFEIKGRFDHSDIRGCNLMVL